ncbi:unnamed protein product [Meloidogyne enterolobii]|uniref:Uncharacterized protein n=1 Tax=Meloidogyne enterolobii TaxID=390850 RepID=A0ACB0YE29_MELEN
MNLNVKTRHLIIRLIILGIPPVIYLTMNKSIQRDCYRILKKCVKSTMQSYKNLHSNAVQPLSRQMNFEREDNQVNMQN